MARNLPQRPGARGRGVRERAGPVARDAGPAGRVQSLGGVLGSRSAETAEISLKGLGRVVLGAGGGVSIVLALAAAVPVRRRHVPRATAKAEPDHHRSRPAQPRRQHPAASRRAQGGAALVDRRRRPRPMADPIPHALALTTIVITFGVVGAAARDGVPQLAPRRTTTRCENDLATRPSPAAAGARRSTTRRLAGRRRSKRTKQPPSGDVDERARRRCPSSSRSSAPGCDPARAVAHGPAGRRRYDPRAS